MFAVILALVSCVLFIFLTIEVSDGNENVFSDKWLIGVEFSLSIFFIWDYVLHFFLAESKQGFYLTCLLLFSSL